MKELNFAGAREWKDEFSFLAKNGLDNLYLMLLAMASSKSEIRRLHNLLDNNVRLMRPDLIKLENFWEKYVFPEGKISGKHINLDQETLKWLFTTQCGEKNNTEYYFDYLICKSISNLQPFKLYDNRLVVSSEQIIFSGFASFYVDVSDITFLIECFVSNDGGFITIHLAFDENDLTEESTYQLSQITGYYISIGGMFSYFGNTRYLVIDVPFGKKQEFLEEHYSEDYPGHSYYLFKDGFVGYLKDKLIEKGVPLTKLDPF